MNVVLVEGECAEGPHVLGDFDLADIPDRPKGVPRILVSFRISAFGLLTVHAKDLDGPSSAEWQQVQATSGQGSTSA